MTLASSHARRDTVNHMTSPSTTLRTYAELARITNLPTVITNVLTGCALGIAVSAPSEWNMLIILGVCIAIACFYCAGMALNDLADIAIDRVERPSRPIPSGRVSPRSAATFIAILFGIGLIILSLISLPALLMGGILVSLIIAYDLIHALTPLSVILMGACRGTVYVTAAAAMSWPMDWRVLGVFAAALTIYTILFTNIARSETQQQLDRRKWLSIVIPLIVLAPAVVRWPSHWWWAIVAASAALAWLSRAVSHVFASPPHTRQAVMTWLSGFCLIDAYYLTLLDVPRVALVAAIAFALTVIGHRRIAGT
jgi:4-hydroxybenzoate polyprenyltransferase